MIWLPYIAPALFALFALSPLFIREGDKAQRGLLGATWTRQSKGGNNPRSQRVHEGGGARFWALFVVVPGMTAIGALGGSQGDALIFTLLGQLAWWAGSFWLTANWIDVAEHGAEGLHGDAALANGTIHPNAKRWLKDNDFDLYSEGEAHRMTRPGQQYDDMTPEEFTALLASRRWASRILLMLARW